MVMLYRQEYMILYQGDLRSSKKDKTGSTLANDPFFVDNYDRRFSKFSTIQQLE